MNIGDITKGGLSQSNPLSHRKLEKTDLDGRQPARPGNDKDEATHRDSVAISEAGRRALEEEQRRMQDLDMARRVFDAEGALSEERRQEIKARIQAHYYTNPAVIDQIAARVAEDLGASPDGSVA